MDAARATFSAPRPVEPSRLQLLVAVRALRALRRQPEDTRQIFVVLRALRGRSGARLFRRLAQSASGAALLRERPSLRTRLEDRAALARLDAATLGGAYRDFMAAGC